MSRLTPTYATALKLDHTIVWQIDFRLTSRSRRPGLLSDRLPAPPRWKINEGQGFDSPGNAKLIRQKNQGMNCHTVSRHHRGAKILAQSAGCQVIESRERFNKKFMKNVKASGNERFGYFLSTNKEIDFLGV